LIVYQKQKRDFGRQSADERASRFLESASYVDHRSEMPIWIRWRLRNGLQGNLFAQCAAA